MDSEVKIALFVDKDKYYYAGENINCTQCNEELNKMFFLLGKWDKLGDELDYLCQKCFEEFKKKRLHRFAKITEWNVVTITLNIPSTARPRFLNKPQLSTARNLSLADAANQKLCPADHVVDRTRYAGRESFEGAQISYRDPLQLKDDVTTKDLLLTPPDTKLGTADDVMEILADIASMQLEGPQAKKQLGHNKTTEAK